MHEKKYVRNAVIFWPPESKYFRTDSLTFSANSRIKMRLQLVCTRAIANDYYFKVHKNVMISSYSANPFFWIFICLPSHGMAVDSVGITQHFTHWPWISTAHLIAIKAREILNVHHFGIDVNLFVCDGAANVTLTQLYVVYRKWGEIDPIFIICFVLIFSIPIHKRIH